MRDQMRVYCREHRLPFIDMFEPFLEPDGRSADRWFMDNIHLGVKAIPVVATQFEAQGISNFLPSIPQAR
ncbi:MAG: SGNH/GDSL hydrolase family protein [Hoeflea sp.]|uniref:SGNH/GDSL hydrolase family protein n=1 Tax=Hoeflea sp. TaxID=1940281 RepID=UPI001E080DB3|nr:SGNH/GDSL hydrolase family protein [Hoeflea sp.]MBU4527820.1 SGNH/GDSL hydrolase family protein [Alphaproteobacteria bacterium]MBU4546145.1 SGNH/GDSL hydrolase family protein [Alphaproteobacteria bacterium]MBU4553170.1 SGNH/GDSL hydrolase family protein [Alphaproteobacteria bacterium]MBV1724242.1 SGNH/GDSL hydrolase family protein [Hoeflea sp.]MBV1759927.1 SGNH/GDSL hydrolase family protein [Hoeflea sp.]